ncbi:MAG: aminotransferase class V-fold PLP-dependent enzyme [Proteobacteria bacterium]|nr:aminotransferase class V-fold PLP-dependent enzyme [Pseudomonadota bacterium]
MRGDDGLRFSVGRNETCLNNARWHPLSEGAKGRAEAYLAYKARGISRDNDLIDRIQPGVKRDFARLINVNANELAYVNSTTAGETMLVSSLGILGSGKNIVTDALHFEGSLYMYGALRQQGVDVRCVKPRADWRIHLDDLARVINNDTALVAISQVSFVNGFQHDVKAVSDLAHAHGALVYVDAVQAAGAVPVDAHAFDADAVGCASYKWLMGDFGLGFLYVHPRVIPKLHRVVWGYRQIDNFDYHAFTGDPPGTYPASWQQHQDASGFFEIGTYSNATLALLSYSLPAILDKGVSAIQKHAQSLIAIVQHELPQLGYARMTPMDSATPIATFFAKDPDVTRRKLQAANVDVSIENARVRISPSIYNTEADVEKLIDALK